MRTMARNKERNWVKLLEEHAEKVGKEVFVADMAREVSEGRTPDELVKMYNGIPYICLKRFMEANGEMFSLAKRAWADKLVYKGLDGVDEEDVARGRLKVDTYLKVAAKVSKDEWGDGGGSSGGITVVVDRSCGGAVRIDIGKSEGNQKVIDSE